MVKDAFDINAHGSRVRMALLIQSNQKSSAIALVGNSRVPTRDYKDQLHVSLIVGSELRRGDGNAVSVVMVSLVQILVGGVVEKALCHCAVK